MSGPALWACAAVLELDGEQIFCVGHAEAQTEDDAKGRFNREALDANPGAALLHAVVDPIPDKVLQSWWERRRAP